MLPRLWKFLRPHSWLYAAVIVLMVVQVGGQLFIVWFLENVLDAAVARDGDRVRYVFALGGGVLGLWIVVGYILVYLNRSLSAYIQRDMKNAVFHHLLRLPPSFFTGQHSGDLVSRLTNDINRSTSALTSPVELVRGPLAIIIFCTYMVMVNWQLALLVLVIAPMALVASRYLGGALRRNRRTTQRTMGQVNSLLHDVLAAYQVVRIFQLQNLFTDRYRREADRVLTLETRDGRLRALLSAANTGVGYTSFMITMALGALYVAAGTMTVGQLLAFTQAMQMATGPFRGLGNAWAGFQNGLAAVERLHEVLEEEPWLDQLPRRRQVLPLEEGIRYDRVTFSYDGKTPVLQDLSLEVPAGRITALVGPSGSGKTTLFHLTMGFYRVAAGTIRLDGTELEDWDVSELRGLYAYVAQDAYMFSGTVRQNIELGRPGASQADIEAAAGAANAHHFITALPGGYDAQVGEGGALLSGGQRQRIAIARALLKDAPLLLLDEATSALDAEAARAVQEALQRLMVGRTTLIIAHNLETVRIAHQIVVLERGRVQEQGTHQQLLANRGLYYAWLRRRSRQPHGGEGGGAPG